MNYRKFLIAALLVMSFAVQAKDITVTRVCDEMTVINFGRQLATGGPEEIQGNQGVIDAYLGVGD